MTAFSDYAEGAVLDHVFNISSFTQPSALYVQLHTGDPGEAGTSNVATETTRVAFGAATRTGNSVDNDAAIQWSNVAATETYSHISIHDALTAGNCIFKGAMSSSVSVTAGDDFEFAAGDLNVSAD